MIPGAKGRSNPVSKGAKYLLTPTSCDAVLAVNHNIVKGLENLYGQKTSHILAALNGVVK